MLVTKRDFWLSMWSDIGFCYALDCHTDGWNLFGQWARYEPDVKETYAFANELRKYGATEEGVSKREAKETEG